MALKKGEPVYFIDKSLNFSFSESSLALIVVLTLTLYSVLGSISK